MKTFNENLHESIDANLENSKIAKTVITKVLDDIGVNYKDFSIGRSVILFSRTSSEKIKYKYIRGKLIVEVDNKEIYSKDLDPKDIEKELEKVINKNSFY